MTDDDPPFWEQSELIATDPDSGLSVWHITITRKTGWARSTVSFDDDGRMRITYESSSDAAD